MTDKKLRQRLLKKSLDPNFAQKKAPYWVLFFIPDESMKHVCWPLRRNSSKTPLTITLEILEVLKSNCNPYQPLGNTTLLLLLIS
jgi:hypothetical protein